MPDDLDYRWLAWLAQHPEAWSPDDLAAAEQIVADQKRAIEESHAKDVEAHQAKRIVVDGLEAAIDFYRERHGMSQ
jgi:hypothetical protein